MADLDLAAARRALRATASATDARFLQGYFRTGPGEYGAGDRFLGVRVPAVRAVARAHRALPRKAVAALLRSRWHEERLLALLILVEQHRHGDGEARAAIRDLYLANTRHINNWDLVDSSAPAIVGPHVDPARPRLAERLAASNSLWERRIAMLATFHWIKQGDVRPALRIARLLRDDPHDLIHKAVGWGLREVGLRDRAAEEAFLGEHAAIMPRTMLRYALERLPPARRAFYMRREGVTRAR
jgi:3-methyladenine DNA glycosylase AlkD